MDFTWLYAALLQNIQIKGQYLNADMIYASDKYFVQLIKTFLFLLKLINNYSLHCKIAGMFMFIKNEFVINGDSK